MMKHLLPVLLVGLLSACGSVGTQFVKMAEPADGERARVRIAANMLVRGVPESECNDLSKEGAGTVFGGIVGSSGYRGRSLDMPNPNNFSSRSAGEMYVRAGKPVTYVLSNTPESRMRCNIAVTFTPKAGRDYELAMQTERSGMHRSLCSAQVSDITGGRVQPVEIRRTGVCRKK